MKRTIALALMLAACGGKAVNDRDANWCLHPNLSPGEWLTARNALHEWNDESGGRVRFRVADGRCENTVLRAEAPDDRPEGREPAGSLTVCGSGNCLNQLEIYSYRSFRELRVIVLHELGHYLTGPEHSEERSDVMFRGGFTGQAGLTQADLDRLDWPEWRRRHDP